MVIFDLEHVISMGVSYIVLIVTE